MDELTPEIITKRLERLERQNSRFKMTGILALLAIFTFILMGQIPVNQEVRAQKFSLYDARGKNRAMLFSRDGQAILVLAAPDGEPRMTLVVGADGTPALGLFDKGDKVRAELSVDKGSSRLALYAKEEGKPRALFSVSPDGLPRLGLTDKNQSPVSRSGVRVKNGAWQCGTRRENSLVVWAKKNELPTSCQWSAFNCSRSVSSPAVGIAKSIKWREAPCLTNTVM
jgi:hypothetical protein